MCERPAYHARPARLAWVHGRRLLTTGAQPALPASIPGRRVLRCCFLKESMCFILFCRGFSLSASLEPLRCCGPEGSFKHEVGIASYPFSALLLFALRADSLDRTAHRLQRWAGGVDRPPPAQQILCCAWRPLGSSDSELIFAGQNTCALSLKKLGLSNRRPEIEVGSAGCAPVANNLRP